MRWWSIPILLAVVWLAFTLTPFWALYDLARAVQAGDAGYVERHVNFRVLRLSVVRQATAIVRSDLEATGGIEPRERQRLADVAAALASPLAETLVTPQTVIDLLDDGWPQSLVPDAAPAESGTPGLRIDGIGRLLPFYLRSEMRGFRTVVISVPPDAERARRFRLRLRLRGLTWRLVDIELPDDLRHRLARRFAVPEDAVAKP